MARVGRVEGAIFGVNAQTGTTYSLTVADRGKLITLSNASAIALTVPTGLGAGYSCTIVQKGAGVITVTASGTTIVNRSTQLRSAGTGAVLFLISDVANNFFLAGDTQT